MSLLEQIGIASFLPGTYLEVNYMELGENKRLLMSVSLVPLWDWGSDLNKGMLSVNDFYWKAKKICVWETISVKR